MAATKRKTRGAKKAGKKSAIKMQKRTVSRTKGRKSIKTSSPKRAVSSVRVVRIPPISSVNKPFTKGQLFTMLAGRTGLQRKEVSTFFDELKSIIAAHLRRQGPGQFTLPSLIKLTVVHKPATKARKGINPFTGEEMMFKAKPARNVVKARALKQLKSMV